MASSSVPGIVGGLASGLRMTGKVGRVSPSAPQSLRDLQNLENRADLIAFVLPGTITSFK